MSVNDGNPDAHARVMKWLTREWQGGGFSDAEHEARREYWRAHHERLRPQLPPGLRLLAGEPDDLGYVSLHDAVVDWWVLDGSRSLALEVFCGDEQIGYRRLVVQYRGRVELVGADEGELHRWLDDTRTEFLYDEVDLLEDGRFEHRHLLWPEGEFGVRFEDVVVIAAHVPASGAWEYGRRRRFESSSAFGRLVWAHEAGRELVRELRRHADNLSYAVEQFRHPGQEE